MVGTKPRNDIRFGAWVNDKYEEFPFRGIYPITVCDEKEGWLRIFDGHREAWAQKADFVLSRDAPAYFTDRVRANPSDAWAWQMRGVGWYDRFRWVREHGNKLFVGYTIAVAELARLEKADPPAKP